MIQYRLSSQGVTLLQLVYDKEGPRFIQEDPTQCDSKNDLTFHGSVVPADSFESIHREKSRTEYVGEDDMIAGQACGQCGELQLVSRLGGDTLCPNCGQNRVKEVGGWK